MAKKSDLESQCEAAHSQILDEAIRKIHLQQQIVEQKELAEDFI